MNLIFSKHKFFLTDVKSSDKTTGFKRQIDGNYMSYSYFKALDYADYGEQKLQNSLTRLKTEYDRSFASTPTREYLHPSQKFFNYQQAGIEILCDRFKNKKALLLADSMGLGKTVQALGICNELNLNKVLILCPSVAKYNWLSFIKRWYLNEDARVQVINGNQEINPEYEVTILNYDIMFRENHMKVLKSIPFDIIIADEAHQCKTTGTKRTDALYGKDGLIHNTSRFLAVSGTPVTNKVVDFYPFLLSSAPEIMKPDTGYWAFAKRYAGAYQGHFGWQLGKKATNTEELNFRLRATVMVRRLKADVMSELPDKILQLIEFDSGKSFRKEENNLLTEFKISKTDLKNLIQSELGKAVETSDTHEKDHSVLAMMAELRRAATEAKMEDVLKWIHQTMLSVDKLVVFAHHRDTIKILKEQLKQYNCVVVDGSVSSEKRFDLANQFQNDENTKIFIGNIKAAGVAIDLTAASHVAFVEIDWSASDIQQAIDRTHRIGQKNAVNAYFLTLADSMDSYMMQNIIDKQENNDNVLDSRLQF